MSENKFVVFVLILFLIVAVLVLHDVVTVIALAIPTWLYTIAIIIQIIAGGIMIKVSPDKFGDVVGTLLLAGGVLELIYIIV